MPLLLLDDFTVHKTGTVLRAIQELGVQVEFIPPGCTGMVQPVDVGYNKPLKAHFRAQYRDWVMEQDPNLPVQCPDRQQVATWILAAEQAVTDEVVRNAWRKTGFSYFPDN